MASRNRRNSGGSPRPSRRSVQGGSVRSSSRYGQSFDAASPERYSRNSGAYGRQSGSFGSAGASAQYSRTNPSYSHKAAKKMGRGKKVAIGVFCSLLVVLVGCGAAAALFINQVNQDLSGGKTEEEQMAITEKLVPTTNFDEPFYMLLIGSDRRADDESMGARSDTNILVRVDAPNAQVTMVSIPRDTKIELAGYGTQKFNAIYNYEGVAGVIEESSELCGVDISHYAEVNFEELISLVDAVGGVEVEVPELIDDPDAGDVVIQPGLQYLDGEAALVFARSRAYADGDFTRTSNQRLLIEALANKVLSLPATELPGVIQKAAKCVSTDLNVNELYSLVMQVQGAGDLTVYSAMVPSTTAMIDGISYVVTDTYGLADMMEIVDAGGDPNTVELSGYAAIGSSLYSSSSSSDSDSSSSYGDSGSDYGYGSGYGDSGSGYDYSGSSSSSGYSY